MIKLTDTIKLAYTKLRTRKIRTIISLLTASLLFSLLVAGSLVVTGALNSLESFSQEGFSNRYIASGVNGMAIGGFSMTEDTSLIVRAKQLEKEEIAAKKAAAKRLNILYDDTIDSMNAAVTADPSGNEYLNFNSKFAQQAIAEKQAASPNKIDFDKFKKQVGEADHFYRGVSRDQTRSDSPTLTLMREGKEIYNTDDKKGVYSLSNYGAMSEMAGLSSVTAEWNLFDAGLLEAFVLKGQNLEIGVDGSLPIVASYSAAQEVLKLPKLAGNATAQDKKERLEIVREQIAGKTFELCYRNNTSSADLASAIQMQEQIKQNSSKPDFIKPELIYKPSTEGCQAPVVERDVRTTDSKAYQSRQDEFDRQFGKKDPASQIIKFRIVGVTQDSPFATGMGGMGGLGDILNMILASSIGARWVSPTTVLENSAAAKDIFAISPVQMYPQEVFFAEYSDADTARNVLNTKSCRLFYDVPLEVNSGSGSPACSEAGSSFTLQSFGSASLAVHDFKQGFRKVQFYAALIIGVIAAVILIGMIGRIIADARKETAVFRATGATRFMVAQIYLMYTLYLVLIMIALSLAIGFSVSLWLNSVYSPDASVNMALMFNIADLNKPFLFYGLDVYDIGVVSATVLTAALIGASVPIAGNIRRNPINDMRDE